MHVGGCLITIQGPISEYRGRQVQQNFYEPQSKLIVMSATMDVNLFFSYFSSEFYTSIIEVNGRTFPIEDEYLNEDPDNYVTASIRKALEIHHSDQTGDILVFLTGLDEIELAIDEVQSILLDSNDKTAIALPLHGKLSEEESALVFEKSSVRKIIFATNVAETSLTIDGVKHVIDTGMVKEVMWDDKRKMQILKVGNITQSSVKQRRGRAGRTSSGKCYHLYTLETYESLDVCQRAEILCIQPSMAVLKLKYLGVENVETFEWLEPPSQSSIKEAMQSLKWLDALDHQTGKLTPIGIEMARLTINPMLAAMLFKARELNCLQYGLIIAGMLTVAQNIWWRGSDDQSKQLALESRLSFTHKLGDHFSLLKVYLEWNSIQKRQRYEWCKNNFINAKAMKLANDFVEEISKQIQSRYYDNIQELDNDMINKLLLCICAGYFQNLAIANGPLRAGYKIASEIDTTARVHRTSTLTFTSKTPKYVLFNELININSTNYMTTICSIDLKLLLNVSKPWYNYVNIEYLRTTTYESYCFNNIGPSLLSAIVGKKCCKLKKLEELIGGLIETDFQQAKLTIWCQQLKMDNAKQTVEDILKTEREKLFNETEEVQIIDSTRSLVGAGGVSHLVLVQNEFIKIILKRLPANVTEGEIRTICEAFGNVRNVYFLRQSNDDSSAAVVFNSISDASMASNKLNGYIYNGRSITATPSYMQTTAHSSVQNCRLKAIWYLTESDCSGKIHFTNETMALETYKQFQNLLIDRQRIRCQYSINGGNLPTLKVNWYIAQNNGLACIKFSTIDQAIDAVVKMNKTILNGRSILCQLAKRQYQPDKFTVFIKHLASDVDEDDIKTHFSLCVGLLDIVVFRGMKGALYKPPEDAKENIKIIFSQYETFQHESIIICPQINNCKVEAYVQFINLNELKQAIEDMNEKSNLIGYGKIRLMEKIVQENKRKDKEKIEYIIKLYNLSPDTDELDIIQLLKQRNLYNSISYILVYRKKENIHEQENKFTDKYKEMELSKLKSLFISDQYHTLPNIQIFSPTANGKVTALILFDDLRDVTTAINIFDNKLFVLGESKIRLIPHIMYTVFLHSEVVEVISNKIEQLINYVKQNMKDVHIKKKKTQNKSLKIFIDGTDIKQIATVRIEFDKIMKGIEFTFDDANWVRISVLRQVLAMGNRYRELEIEFGVSINIILTQYSIKVVGEENTVVKCVKRIEDLMNSIRAPSSSSNAADCPICLSPVEVPYSLQGCGHVYCRQCLVSYIETKYDTTLNTKALKVTCLVDSCNSLCLLRDLKALTDVNFYKLAKASFQAFIREQKDLVDCLDPECRQVYRSSTHSSTYICDTCTKIYCLECKVEYHVGMTCQAFKKFINKDKDDELLRINLGSLGFKCCPNCEILIDKYEGCNSVKCKQCDTAFCWLCKYTDPVD
ncbi:unnamed protein product, partial [Didymodactylos carnosus]